MKNAKLVRQFNYVQFQLEECGLQINRTRYGARLGWVRRYIKLFGEYVALRKQMRATFGAQHTSRMEKVSPLDRSFVFNQLNKLEEAAYADLYERMQ